LLRCKRVSVSRKKPGGEAGLFLFLLSRTLDARPGSERTIRAGADPEEQQTGRARRAGGDDTIARGR
jgi:hypothetical protein